MAARNSDSLDRETLLPLSYPPPSSPSQHTGPSNPILSRPRSWRALINTRLGRIVVFSGATLIALLALHGIFKPDYKAGVQKAYSWANGSGPPPGQDGRPYTAHMPEPTGSSGSTPGGIMNAGTGSGPGEVEGTGYAYGAHVEGHEWTMDELREMVKGTKGYYVRDWSLGLGWNNMRYIIEASLLHAQLLNRTLVLPSFVYMRGCEFSHDVCAAYAPQVDRFKEVGWRRDLSGRWERQSEDILLDPSIGAGLMKREDGQKDHTGWRVPIEYMFDLPHLRASQPVVLVSEYLTLHGLNPSSEWKSGMWGRWAYEKDNTYYMLPNQQYDPQDILRVDRLLPEVQQYIDNWTERGQLIQARLQLKKGNSELGMMEWEDVKDDLRDIGEINVDDEEGLELALREAGLSVLYTFQGSRGIDLIKHVTEPIRQVAPTKMLRGLYDDVNNINDEVLLLEGEVHLWRKPGSLRFTTSAARSNFQSIVLHSMQPHPRVREIGDLMARHLTEKVGGRMYFAGHLRRGDFVELGWALAHDIAPHLKMVTDAFQRGTETIKQIKASGDAHVAPVPGVQLNTTVLTLELPQQGDPFFLATDERGVDELAYCRSQGALLTPDIISFTDRRMYGWELLFSDIVMLVEQVVMSQSGFFYGYGASSVAGGTLNQRAARGRDPRTGVVE
ncbi:hypothetical protein CALCODRAFT_466636 [Calocera cornea HHB12733]|uniref:O-fucosyltransferase family protein n=1 Tax=Calocera cornea HHB12733 TaxID=1353952 RepID=A0A165HSJ1_9BASI|nr:hypothetical protein CALCODRAFT_466636 [Calocera cornea HHB12733]